LAFGLTCALCAGLALYAFYTKNDFTMMGGFLFCFCFILIVAGLFGLFTSNPIFHIVIASLALVLYSLYLIYDIQLMVGKHSDKYQIDDFIFAATNLYIDFMEIFL